MVATGELTADQDRRRRLRFSLRVLFAVTSAAAILFLLLPGWWTHAMERPAGMDRLLFLLGTLGLIGIPSVLLLFVYGKRLGIRPGEILIGMSLAILTLTTAIVAMHPMLWIWSWLPLFVSILLFAVGAGCAFDRAKPRRTQCRGCGNAWTGDHLPVGKFRHRPIDPHQSTRMARQGSDASPRCYVSVGSVCCDLDRSGNHFLP